MPKEIELKLRISSADIPRLRRHPAVVGALAEKPVTRKLTSIYYDTPQLALLDAGISLRVRRMSGSWFQAVKAAGHSSAGLHQRMEWEDIIAFGHPDFSKITEPGLIRIFDAPGIRAALTPIFSTEVRRTEWHLAWDNGDRIELALDMGSLVIGEKREPINEIELELKGGRTARLFELALALQQDMALELENVSKAQRGYAHYRPQPPAVVRAQHTHLQKNLDSRAAFRQIAWECLGHLQGNQGMVLHGNDIEGIHQMRVALRRLRSSFNVFRDVIDRERSGTILDDIRWITDVLGKARDIDVFIAETLPPVMRQVPEHPGLEELRSRAGIACRQSYADVRNALSSQRYHRLMLSLGAFLETADQDALAMPSLTAETVARTMLDKRYRQLKRHGQRLSEMNPDERHAARIAAKKLRYAVEFFSSFHPEAKVHPFIQSLAHLQNILGELNDMTVTARLVHQLTGARPNRVLDEALHLFTGWNAGNALHRLAHMAQAWKRFARHKPFWN